MEIIDISVPLSSRLPTWPGGHGLNISALAVIGMNSDANVSRLDMDVHCGTHIDAPLHFVANGKTTNDINLSTLIGNAYVAEIDDHIRVIDAETLSALNIPNNVSRLLLKTANSSDNLWDSPLFETHYVALSVDAAQWVIEKKIQLIGIDYCSIQKFDDSPETHQILLKNEVVILEGLDLRNVDEAQYQLICLPVKALGLEGVPVRAILIRQ